MLSVQRRPPFCKNIPGFRTRFRGRAKSVRYAAGIAFAIYPERCSALSRICVRIYPGTAFGLARIPQICQPAAF